MFTAYYIKIECSVKDFTIFILFYYKHIFMLLACIKFDSSKKMGSFHAMYLKSAFSVLLLTLNLKEIYNELTYS